ncbi:translation initiation factor IF-2-like [Varanus komodoensis]|uniref:translation initiation factor IF-2-like n=1 Tax=Varanus komodoensis TaxID=61221 RepID=UPI001CF7E139|nr:translation initiation factor IF-2-like [Varanus komodoensis]
MYMFFIKHYICINGTVCNFFSMRFLCMHPELSTPGFVLSCSDSDQGRESSGPGKRMPRLAQGAPPSWHPWPLGAEEARARQPGPGRKATRLPACSPPPPLPTAPPGPESPQGLCSTWGRYVAPRGRSAGLSCMTAGAEHAALARRCGLCPAAVRGPPRQHAGQAGHRVPGARTPGPGWPGAASGRHRPASCRTMQTPDPGSGPGRGRLPSPCHAPSAAQGDARGSPEAGRPDPSADAQHPRLAAGRTTIVLTAGCCLLSRAFPRIWAEAARPGGRGSCSEAASPPAARALRKPPQAAALASPRGLPVFPRTALGAAAQPGPVGGRDPRPVHPRLSPAPPPVTLSNTVS